jgi:hypothetical protein
MEGASWSRESVDNKQVSLCVSSSVCSCVLILEHEDPLARYHSLLTRRSSDANKAKTDLALRERLRAGLGTIIV